MAFPLAKLGFLLMKQLCKPLARFIKNEAKEHPFFRKYFCIPPAKAYHWVDLHLLSAQKFRGRAQPVPPPLTEEEEVELGAELLGEFILFTLLSTVLLMEINRQGDKKALKEKTQKDEITTLVETVSDLMYEVNELKEILNKMQKRLDSTIDDILEFEDMKYPPEELLPNQPFMGFWSSYRRRRKKSDLDELDDSDPDSP